MFLSNGLTKVLMIGKQIFSKTRLQVKFIVVLLLIVGLLTLMLTTGDVRSAAGFALWMGGFATSEVIFWVTKPKCVKAKPNTKPIESCSRGKMF